MTNNKNNKTNNTEETQVKGETDLTKIIKEVLYLIIRGGQLIFALVIIGIEARLIHTQSSNLANSVNGRDVFALMLGCLSLVLSSYLILSKDITLKRAIIDYIFGSAWFTTFGILFVQFQGLSCAQSFKEVGSLAMGGTCNQRRAAWVFAFLSGCFWMAGAALGGFIYYRARKAKKEATGEEKKKDDTSWLCL